MHKMALLIDRVTLMLLQQIIVWKLDFQSSSPAPSSPLGELKDSSEKGLKCCNQRPEAVPICKLFFFFFFF